jgi:hypothetical protein
MAKVLIQPEAEEGLFEFWLYLSQVSDDTTSALTKAFVYVKPQHCIS